MILKGIECTELGTVIKDNNIYDFGYNGSDIIYDKRVDGNKSNNISSYNKMEESVERIILNKICDELKKEYGNISNMEDRINSMSTYINLINQNVDKIKIPDNIEYDFSSVEKAKKTENEFLRMCNIAFLEIDKDIKNKIDLINKMNINTQPLIHKNFDDTFIDTLRNKLTDEERNLVSIYMSKGLIDEYTALLMVYNERGSVKEYINQGYLLEEAIKESFKHTKVRVLAPPKKEAAYVDVFALLIVGEIFIYGLIILILMFIK